MFCINCNTSNEVFIELLLKNNNDIDIKFFQNILLQLFHGSHCKNKNCEYQYCTFSKKLWYHIWNCNINYKSQICNFKNCNISKILFTHWTDCNNNNCLLCYKVNNLIKYVDDKTGIYNGSLNMLENFE